MHWKITALVCAMFSYIGFAQAADSFTIHVAGDTRQCEIPRPSVCRNHTNAMWMYFDEKGQIFVYDDVDSGVMLKPGKRSGSYLHKDYPAHTQVSYSKNGEVYKFNMKITMKRKGIYYNKSMNWSYTFRINGNKSCVLTQYTATSRVGLRFSNPRVKHCRIYQGRKRPVF